MAESRSRESKTQWPRGIQIETTRTLFWNDRCLKSSTGDFAVQPGLKARNYPSSPSLMTMSKRSDEHRSLQGSGLRRADLWTFAKLCSLASLTQPRWLTGQFIHKILTQPARGLTHREPSEGAGPGTLLRPPGGPSHRICHTWSGVAESAYKFDLKL